MMHVGTIETIFVIDVCIDSPSIGTANVAREGNPERTEEWRDERLVGYPGRGDRLPTAR
jgi:hypothetical protein